MNLRGPVHTFSWILLSIFRSLAWAQLLNEIIFCETFSNRQLNFEEKMLCRFIIWMAVASISSKCVLAATDKIVCYHGTWSKYRTGNGAFAVSNIDPTLCTHLIYSFVGLSTANNGSVVSLDSYLDITLGNLIAFNALKTQNTNLKTLLAIGGWNEGSAKYSTVAASASLRAAFIQSALEWVQTYGFDGFDLDWEYPAQRGGATTDVANFATLVKEFRAVFDQHNLLLSAAVGATQNSISLSYDVASLSHGSLNAVM
ncbi:hypothetical protein JTB14_015364 [Gonioctena quinquepunctata]|nr:hypothetical protein JTB14_015364 [Gonioctena quinquepunctata]